MIQRVVYMLKVVEVNDNDIFGKIFNGYDIMEQLNKDDNFKVKQLVLNKFSNNKNVERTKFRQRQNYNNNRWKTSFSTCRGTYRLQHIPYPMDHWMDYVNQVELDFLWIGNNE